MIGHDIGQPYWQEIDNHVARPEPDPITDPDEDAEFEKHRQRAIDEAREEQELLRENDAELDREAREVIRAERARLEATE